jgi:molybdate transport system substrate-binding protein
MSAISTHRSAAVLLALAASLAPGVAVPEAGALIAVAANMGETTRAIAEQFHARHGIRVRLSVGSSGNLTRQILRGAPFQMFISADEDYPRRLAERGRTRGAGHVYAIGRLALYVPLDSPVRAPPPGDALRERMAAALVAPGVRRFAIASPEHAPYGRAARAVLEHLGRWRDLRARLVIGESVAQAARFARAGGVQGALLPVSLAREPALAQRGRHVLVPQTWHAPLRQRMVLLTDAGGDAAAFYEFMRGEPARRILLERGYAPPEGS